mmetsp:Transcript_5353/g.4541  ORF Transcript_5353/g.4541 Transcript_5353/m.4541 type:complete len:104 (-) Transcript_5353:300-611(-)
MKNDNTFESYKAKICLVGESGVGKTSIYNRFMKDEFLYNTNATQFPEYSNKKTIIQGNSSVKLNVWDTAGQAKYLALNASFLKGAVGFIMVFDMTDNESFLTA